MQHIVLYNAGSPNHSFCIVPVPLLQLSGATKSSDTQNEWQNVVSDAKATIAELEDLKTSCNSLSGDGGGNSEGERTLVGPEVVACAKEVCPLVNELVELERLHAYLQWMKRILQLR